MENLEGLVLSKRTKCKIRMENGHEIPYAINGYRNGRGKKFHIPERGSGASGFMNEISFPEKTPPIRGLREAGRFILGRIQADQFVPLLCQGIRIPYRDRPIKRFISISCATNFGNRIFHRLQRIVFATFENDMDYDFDSDSMGIVFLVFFLLLVASLSTRMTVSRRLVFWKKDVLANDKISR